MTLSKICTSCNIDMSILNFYNNKTTKDSLSYTCKICAKKYKEKNKDHINKLRVKRYKNNPKKYNLQSNKSHKKHRQDRLIKQRLYFKNNKDYFYVKNKKYRQENIDSILLRNRQRKLLLKNFPIIKQLEINQLLKEHEYKCFYCKIEVKRRVNLHIDHKISLFCGGEHTINNLVPACKSCNLRKGIKTVEEFLIIINGENNAD